MQDLIERLEKASGSDRELDGLIYGLIHGLKRNHGTFQTLDKFQFEHPTKRHPNDPAALYVPDGDVAEFTASIDAALSLVPEGCEFEVGSAHLVECFWATAISTHHTCKGNGRSAALALCIAALKARASVTV